MTLNETTVYSAFWESAHVFLRPGSSEFLMASCSNPEVSGFHVIYVKMLFDKLLPKVVSHLVF